MVKARAWFFALLLPACTESAPGSGSAAASSDVAPGLSASDFCHAILLAPLDRKLASCKAADQGSDLEAEREAIKKAHAVCLEQIARPVEDGRLSLDEAKARECIAAVEQRGDAWVGPHALAWNLAPLSACRAVFGPRQAAGDESLSRCVKEVYEKRFSAPSPGGNQVVRVTATIRLGPPDPNDEPYLSPKGELFPRARKQASWPVISTCQSPPARGLYCGAHVDCGVDEYCSSGYVADDPNQCLPRKAAGTRCSQSAECKGRCQRDICVSSCGSG